jgi:hypothetical protein
MTKHKIKAIDPFYTGKRRVEDESTFNDPPAFNHRVAHRRQRLAKLRELHAQTRTRQEARDAVVAAAQEATRAKLGAMTRGERKAALARGGGKVTVSRKATRVRLEPVVTTAVGNPLDEFKSILAPVAAPGDAEANAVTAEIAALVKKQTRAMASDVGFAKQFALSDAMAQKRRSRKELEAIADGDADPQAMLARVAPKRPFVDADDLTRTMLAHVALDRADGEKYFDYEARLQSEVDKASRVTARANRPAAAAADSASAKSRLSSARRWRERVKERNAARDKRRAERQADNDDDNKIFYEPTAFGDVAEAPPRLPALPQRLLKRKAPAAAAPFVAPTEKQIIAAERAGVPLIESVAGGRAATRAAITNSKRSTTLVGASSLAVEDYADQVRQQYRMMKRKRRAL